MKKFEFDRLESVLNVLPAIWLTDASLVAVALRLRAADFCRATPESIETVAAAIEQNATASSLAPTLRRPQLRAPTLPQTIRRTLRRLERRRFINSRLAARRRRQAILSHRAAVATAQIVGESDEEADEARKSTTRSLPTEAATRANAPSESGGGGNLSDELRAISARLGALRSRWTSSTAAAAAVDAAAASNRLSPPPPPVSEQTNKQRTVCVHTSGDESIISSRSPSPPRAIRHRRQHERREREQDGRDKRPPSSSSTSSAQPRSTAQMQPLNVEPSDHSNEQPTACLPTVAASSPPPTLVVPSDALAVGEPSSVTRLDLSQLSDNEQQPQVRTWTEIAVFERPSAAAAAQPRAPSLPPLLQPQPPLQPQSPAAAAIAAAAAASSARVASSCAR